MNDDISCFLITHGDLGRCLIRISEKLVSQKTTISFYSNQEKTLEEIEKEILTKIEKNNTKHNLFFIDLAGGSCWMLANRLKRNNPNMAVIGGVNIPMLVSFQMNCSKMDWNDLLNKLVEDGKKGIVLR
jgi:mannose/fructose-specific phosphotransferase system component IIA